MTTIITRLYPDQATAQAAVASLLAKGQSADTISIITAGPTVAQAMKAARVPARSAAIYGAAMTAKQALLVVQAPFSPIGTALTAIRTLNKHPALDAGVRDEDYYLREHASPDYANSIMSDHPFMMSNPFRRPSHGHIFGENPIAPSKPRNSAIRGGAYMSKMFWPMKLVSHPVTRSSALRGGRLFSSVFGIPLLTKSWPSRDELPTILRD